jgi:hypothetical protein
MTEVDIAWYAPERKAEALRLVRKLPLSEIRQRGLDANLRGLRFFLSEIWIPNGDGRSSGNPGVCVMTNLIGTSGISPSAFNIETGIFRIFRYATLGYVGKGIAFANWNERIWESEEMQAHIKHQFKAEENSRDALDKRKQAAFLEECLAVAGSVSRYLEIIRELNGRRRTRVLLEICFQGRMPKNDLNLLQRYIKRFDFDDREPELAADPEVYALEAMSECVTRRERTR